MGKSRARNPTQNPTQKPTPNRPEPSRTMQRLRTAPCPQALRSARDAWRASVDKSKPSCTSPFTSRQSHHVSSPYFKQLILGLRLDFCFTNFLDRSTATATAMDLYRRARGVLPFVFTFILGGIARAGFSHRRVLSRRGNSRKNEVALETPNTPPRAGSLLP